MEIRLTGWLKGSDYLDSKYHKIVFGLVTDNKFEYDENYLGEDEEFNDEEISEINSFISHIQNYDYTYTDVDDYEIEIDGEEVDSDLKNNIFEKLDNSFLENISYEFEYDIEGDRFIFDARIDEFVEIDLKGCENANLFHPLNLTINNNEIWVDADSDSISGIYHNDKFYFTSCSDEPVDIENEEKIFQFIIVNDEIVEDDQVVTYELDEIDEMQMKVGEIQNVNDVYSINLLELY